MLKHIQHQFLDQITGKSDTGFSDQIIHHGNISKQDRIDIYSNAYKIRLKQCIKTDHPVLTIYLGDKLFEQMVSKYIECYPSNSYTLRSFANQLPNFLKKQNPYRGLPIIAEIAEFEKTLLSAFDAAELETSTLDDLTQTALEKWPLLTFRLHPSTRILITKYNVVEIWQAIKQEQAAPEPIKTSDNYWLIWRNLQRLTEFKSLSYIDYELMTFISDEKSFAQICVMLSNFYSEGELEYKILNHLTALIQLNLIKLEADN